MGIPYSHGKILILRSFSSRKQTMRTYVARPGYAVDPSTIPRLLTKEEILTVVAQIPPVFGQDRKAVELATAQVRSYYARTLVGKRIAPIMIPRLIQGLVAASLGAKIHPGTPVGLNNSEAINRQLQQMAISLGKHGGGSVVTSSIDQIKEIMLARPVKDPITTIHFLNKNLSYQDVLEMRRQIIRTSVADLIERNEIDLDSSFPPTWWRKAYLGLYPDVSIRDTGTTILRLYVHKHLMVMRRITMDELAETLTNGERGIVCIPSPISIGQLDVFVQTSPMMDYLRGELKVVASIGDNDSIMRTAFFNLIMKNFPSLIVKGIRGIREAYPMKHNVWNISTYGVRPLEPADEVLYVINSEPKGRRWVVGVNKLKMRRHGILLSKLISLIRAMKADIIGTLNEISMINFPDMAKFDMYKDRGLGPYNYAVIAMPLVAGKMSPSAYLGWLSRTKWNDKSVIEENTDPVGEEKRPAPSRGGGISVPVVVSDEDRPLQHWTRTTSSTIRVDTIPTLKSVEDAVLRRGIVAKKSVGGKWLIEKDGKIIQTWVVKPRGEGGWTITKSRGAPSAISETEPTKSRGIATVSEIAATAPTKSTIEDTVSRGGITITQESELRWRITKKASPTEIWVVRPDGAEWVITKNKIETILAPNVPRDYFSPISRDVLVHVNMWYLDARGENMEEIYSHPDVDTDNTVSNIIHVVDRYFGVVCGYNFFVGRLCSIIAEAGAFTTPRSVGVIAEQMFSKGTQNGVDYSGFTRHSGDVISIATSQKAFLVLTTAAKTGEIATTESPSASTFAGRDVSIGSGSQYASIDLEKKKEFSEEKKRRDDAKGVTILTEDEFEKELDADPEEAKRAMEIYMHNEKIAGTGYSIRREELREGTETQPAIVIPLVDLPPISYSDVTQEYVISDRDVNIDELSDSIARGEIDIIALGDNIRDVFVWR